MGDRLLILLVAVVIAVTSVSFGLMKVRNEPSFVDKVLKDSTTQPGASSGLVDSLFRAVL